MIRLNSYLEKTMNRYTLWYSTCLRENGVFPWVGFYSGESISELKRRAVKKVADALRGKKRPSGVYQEVMGKTRASILVDQIWTKAISKI